MRLWRSPGWWCGEDSAVRRGLAWRRGGLPHHNVEEPGRWGSGWCGEEVWFRSVPRGVSREAWRGRGEATQSSHCGSQLPTAAAVGHLGHPPWLSRHPSQVVVRPSQQTSRQPHHGRRALASRLPLGKRTSGTLHKHTLASCRVEPPCASTQAPCKHPSKHASTQASCHYSLVSWPLPPWRCPALARCRTPRAAAQPPLPPPLALALQAAGTPWHPHSHPQRRKAREETGASWRLRRWRSAPQVLPYPLTRGNTGIYANTPSAVRTRYAAAVDQGMVVGETKLQWQVSNNVNCNGVFQKLKNCNGKNPKNPIWDPPLLMEWGVIPIFYTGNADGGRGHGESQ